MTKQTKEIKLRLELAELRQALRLLVVRLYTKDLINDEDLKDMEQNLKLK